MHVQLVRLLSRTFNLTGTLIADYQESTNSSLLKIEEEHMNFKTLIVMIGLVGLVTGPAFAGQVTFDFVDLAAVLGEHGTADPGETFTDLSGLSVTASGRSLESYGRKLCMRV